MSVAVVNGANPLVNRRFGLVIVGDEILSGRRQDKHFSKVVSLLSARGLQLSWAQVLPDDFDTLVAVYRRTFASGDVVFSCGGIGATPDDMTRQAAAEALGVEVELHPEAKVLITQRCVEMAAQGKGTADMNAPENRQRLQMGEFPAGCEIVENTYNRIPGFFVQDHTFVPGFPVMAWPMLETMLDTRYAHLHHRVAHAENSFLVYGLPESRLTPAMQTVTQRWPDVKVFSLPSVGEGGERAHIELGVKGNPEQASEAFAWLREQAHLLGGECSA